MAVSFEYQIIIGLAAGLGFLVIVNVVGIIFYCCCGSRKWERKGFKGVGKERHIERDSLTLSREYFVDRAFFYVVQGVNAEMVGAQDVVQWADNRFSGPFGVALLNAIMESPNFIVWESHQDVKIRKIRKLVMNKEIWTNDEKRGSLEQFVFVCADVDVFAKAPKKDVLEAGQMIMDFVNDSDMFPHPSADVARRVKAAYRGKFGIDRYPRALSTSQFFSGRGEKRGSSSSETYEADEIRTSSSSSLNDDV